MIALLAERKRPEAMAGSVNVVSALIESMNDESVAGFVADSVVAERGASERLAHAFRSLVPEFDRQRQLLALAREEVAASDMAREQDQEEFKGLWNGVEQMLTSYTDARYVSEDYARELSHARTLPVDVERVSDDPPERIAAWLATVSDAALRSLDQDLLTDLLHIETDPSRWRDIADTVVIARRRSRARRPLRSGVAPHRNGHRAGTPQPVPAAARGRGARAVRERVAHQARRAVPARRQTTSATSDSGTSATRSARRSSCRSPRCSRPSSTPRARKHLRDLLVGFGPKGAEAVRPLLNAQSWEVRRTAGFLLREFGGAEGLKELVPLLADAEPLVQREAVQGLMLNGTKEAAVILLERA